MNDNDIKKALECCGFDEDMCLDCPVQRDCEKDTEAMIYRAKAILDLINRQQAEIERYKGVIKLLEKDVRTAESEAVKEFAERLKEKVNLDLCEAINCSDYLYDLPKLIDNLVKEMTEQSVNYGSSKTEVSE